MKNVENHEINLNTVKAISYVLLLVVILSIWHLSSSVVAVKKELSQFNYEIEHSNKELETKNFKIVLKMLRERENQAIYKPFPKYCD